MRARIMIALWIVITLASGALTLATLHRWESSQKTVRELKVTMPDMEQGETGHYRVDLEILNDGPVTVDIYMISVLLRWDGGLVAVETVIDGPAVLSGDRGSLSIDMVSNLAPDRLPPEDADRSKWQVSVDLRVDLPTQTEQIIVKRTARINP